MKKSISKYFLLIVIVALTYSKVYSQKDSTIQNSITISTGLNQGYFKDLNFSPLNYSISGANYGITYSRRNNKSIFLTSLVFNNNTINTMQQTVFPEANYLQGKVKIAYLRKVNKISNKIDFFLGGHYQSNINYIDWQEESTSFLVAHSLGISFYGEFHFNNKHAINSSISLPLFTLMVRPPYSSFDEELDENLDNGKPLRLITNGYFTSVNNYVSPSFSIQYEYNLTKRFSISGEYQMNYQNQSKNDRFITYQNQIRIGLSHKF